VENIIITSITVNFRLWNLIDLRSVMLCNPLHYKQSDIIFED